MKKIIMLLSNPFEPDPRVYKEANSLASSGYTVSIIAWDRERNYPKYQKLKNITVNRCQYKSAYGKGIFSLFDFLLFYIYIFFQLISAKFDAIHCHDLDTLPIGFLIARLKQSHLFYDAHELEYFVSLPDCIRAFIKKAERYFARRADIIFVVNDIQRKKFQSLKIEDHSIIELKNCPLKSFFSDLKHKSEDGKIVLGWVGFIQAGVGMEKAIRVFEILCKKFALIELLLVGKMHPNYAIAFKKLVENSPNNTKITIVDAVPYEKVTQYYQQIHIAFMLYEALPKYQYSTPTKLYEAMAHGIPVIAAPIGDVESIVLKCQCGFIVNEDDDNDLLEKLGLLIENSALRQCLGQNGFQYAKDHFIWDIMEHRLLSAYQQVLAQKKVEAI